MALVTSQSTLPDFEYEYHTVIVDSVDDSSKQKFTTFFPTPRLVASKTNESLRLSTLPKNKSVALKVDMTSTSAYVSPVLDMQRSSLWLTHNRIDNQDSNGSSLNNINTPINLVVETDKTGGTHLSKHITRPVTLAASAVGLKIILAANRPVSYTHLTLPTILLV